MTEQLTLDGLAHGQALRDQAVALVDKHADTHWRQAALHAVRTLALTQHEITTDDVWARLDPDGYATRERRAMGPIMLAAQREAWITPTDRTRPSHRAVCHAGPKRIWLSRLTHPAR